MSWSLRRAVARGWPALLGVLGHVVFALGDRTGKRALLRLFSPLRGGSGGVSAGRNSTAAWFEGSDLVCEMVGADESRRKAIREWLADNEGPPVEGTAAEMQARYERGLGGGKKTHRYSLCEGGERLNIVTNSGAPESLIVVFHGFGGNMRGFDQAAERWLQTYPNHPVAFAMPEGFLDLGNGGRAWWQVDFQRWLELQERGDLIALANDVPAGAVEAIEKAEGLIASLSSLFSPKKILMSGFSQGAMLAMGVFMNRVAAKSKPPTDTAVATKADTVAPFTGIGLFSPGPMQMQKYHAILGAIDSGTAEGKATFGVPVHIAHGRGDVVIPFVAAQFVTAAFKASNHANVVFTPFDGGHIIVWEHWVAFAKQGLNIE